ncbi:MAG: hypothetical protein AMXMBFR44_1290 [Candidatus Campbellbacteria bacterium]
MRVVSVQDHLDCQNNLPAMLSYLEGSINTGLLTVGRWDSPTGLPAEVLQCLFKMYKERGWRVTWKKGSKAISIWCRKVSA